MAGNHMKKIIVLSVCMLWIMTGCGVKSTLSPNSQTHDPYPVSSLALGEEGAKLMENKVPIHLYFLNERDQKLALEVRHIALEDAKQSTSHLAGVIVKELIAGPKGNNHLRPTMPSGVSMIQEVKINDGVAEVSFSKEFLQGSKEDLSQLDFALYSVVNSLTELKDIHKVNFKIQGQEGVNGNALPKNKTSLERNTVLISNQSMAVDGDAKREDDISVNEILE